MLCELIRNHIRSVEKLVYMQHQTSSSSHSPRPPSALERISESDEEISEGTGSGQRTRCRFSISGCPFQLPSMELHEGKECKYRPTRCPSLTCPVKSPFIKLLRHLEVSNNVKKNVSTYLNGRT